MLGATKHLSIDITHYLIRFIVHHRLHTSRKAMWTSHIKPRNVALFLYTPHTLCNMLPSFFTCTACMFMTRVIIKENSFHLTSSLFTCRLLFIFQYVRFVSLFWLTKKKNTQPRELYAILLDMPTYDCPKMHRLFFRCKQNWQSCNLRHNG